MMIASSSSILLFLSLSCSHAFVLTTTSTSRGYWYHLDPDLLALRGRCQQQQCQQDQHPHHHHQLLLLTRTHTSTVGRTSLSSTTANENSQDNSNNNKYKPDQEKSTNVKKQTNQNNHNNMMTLADLSQKILSNPSKYLVVLESETTTAATKSSSFKNKKKTSSSSSSSSSSSLTSSKKHNKRTRQRVDNPQQTYLYKAQRRDSNPTNSSSSSSSSSSSGVGGGRNRNINVLAREELGLVAATQHCFPENELHDYPQLVGQIRVVVSSSNPRMNDEEEEEDVDDEDVSKEEQEETDPTCFAYIVNKPAGWSILGGSSSSSSSNSKSSISSPLNHSTIENNSKNNNQNKHKKSSRMMRKRIKIVQEDGSMDVLEYNELDVMALLTPEELQEYLEEQQQQQELPPPQGTTLDGIQTTLVNLNDELDNNDEDEDDDDDTAAADDDDQALDHKETVEAGAANEQEGEEEGEEEEDPVRRANLQRIATRVNADDENHDPNGRIDATTATFAHTNARPSVVSWLKTEHWGKNRRGNKPIRGGTFWTAVAGATHVDDSGLVLIAPRQKVNQIRVPSSEYVAIVGSGGSDNLAKTPSTKKDHPSKEMESSFDFETLSRLRRGRSEDVVEAVQVRSKNPWNSCSSIVAACQEKFQQGIRGDPEANPLDRRAPRRLIHCSGLSVVSSVDDSTNSADNSTFVSRTLPVDMAVFVDRGQTTKKFYTAGSFLGRSALQNSNVTNAYREINGAADGYPGWTVDRYDKWLFVQHDPKTSPHMGPLPSIHDGNTAGVYILEQSSPDRSTDGSMRPRRLEGQSAPEQFTVMENGIQYVVSFQDMSTGIFLDQRPQRAWLARNCCPDTRVLNCFAHTGAYSVAAATAGASTVSIDLSRKWLERLPQHMQANGIEFDERHDAIYGDCFDWLFRLAKRGEKYDIVILDPPSSSVGGRKKKRWSIKNDMDELVALAAGLVKKGGLLWTTTNSGSIPPLKFARLCKKGLDDAGFSDAKLERVQPMPADFPSIGPQPVKNFVWRMP